MFPFAGSFVASRSSINGNVFSMQAHRGRPVFPAATIINKVIRNTASHRYPVIMVAIVFF